MNKADLISAVAAESGLSKADAEKAERMGINPATKESITIKAKKAIKFKAGAELSEEIQ